MKTSNKCFRYTLFAIIFYLISSSAYAKAILDIAPSSTALRSVKLAGNGTTTITYSVVNNTNKRTVKVLTIDPYYGITGNPLILTIQNNQCNKTLPPRSSCTFGLLIKANGQTINSVLEPRVCDYDSGTCSVPIESNRISVATGGVANSVAYIINAGNNLLSICPVNTATGALSTCTSSNGNGAFNTPLGLIVNPQGTALFVANYGGTTVAICPIIQDGTGALGTCTTSAGNGTFNNPVGLALNSSGTILYASNNPNASATVAICPVISTGSSFTLGTCTSSDANGTISDVQSVTLSPDNRYAYIANANNSISICPVNPDGSFGTCVLSSGNGTFAYPQGLSFSPDNTYAYVGNFGGGTVADSTISVCPMLQDGSGGFGSCYLATGNTFNFTNNDEVGLYMASPSYFGYIPNNGTIGTNANTISICPISITTHNLGICSLFSDPTFNQPTAIALSYNIT